MLACVVVVGCVGPFGLVPCFDEEGNFCCSLESSRLVWSGLVSRQVKSSYLVFWCTGAWVFPPLYGCCCLIIAASQPINWIEFNSIQLNIQLDTQFQNIQFQISNFNPISIQIKLSDSISIQSTGYEWMRMDVPGPQTESVDGRRRLVMGILLG